MLEVPLVELITAYLDDMESAGVVGYWDDMSEFLLLMSLLVEVKSRMLLPDAFAELEEELTPEEARDQLLARLFIYSQFKAASLRLRDIGEAGSVSLLRRPLGQARVVLPSVEEIRSSGDPTELSANLTRLLAQKADPDSSHLAEVKVELRKQIEKVRKLLGKQERFSFNEVFGAEQPLVQALSVFALLDLMSRGEVKIRQAKLFGDIVVSRLTTKAAS